MDIILNTTKVTSSDVDAAPVLAEASGDLTLAATSYCDYRPLKYKEDPVENEEVHSGTWTLCLIAHPPTKKTYLFFDVEADELKSKRIVEPKLVKTGTICVIDVVGREYKLPLKSVKDIFDQRWEFDALLRQTPDNLQTKITGYIEQILAAKTGTQKNEHAATIKKLMTQKHQLQRILNLPFTDALGKVVPSSLYL